MARKQRVISHTRLSPTTYVSRKGVLTFVQGSPYDPPVREEEGVDEDTVQGNQKGRQAGGTGQVETKRNTVIGEIFSPARNTPEASQWTYKNIFEQLVQYGGQGVGQAQFLGTEVTNVLARYTVYGTVYWNRILNLVGGVNTVFFEAAIIATNDQISTSGPSIYSRSGIGPKLVLQFPGIRSCIQRQQC